MQVGVEPVTSSLAVVVGWFQFGFRSVKPEVLRLSQELEGLVK